MHLKNEEVRGEADGGREGRRTEDKHFLIGKMPPVPPPRKQRLIYSSSGGNGNCGGRSGGSSIYRVVEIDSLSDDEAAEWRRLPNSSFQISEGND